MFQGWTLVLLDLTLYLVVALNISGLAFQMMENVDTPALEACPVLMQRNSDELYKD